MATETDKASTMLDRDIVFQVTIRGEPPEDNGNCNVCGRCGPPGEFCGHCYDRYKSDDQFMRVIGFVLDENKKKRLTARIMFRHTLAARRFVYNGVKEHMKGKWDLYYRSETVAEFYYSRLTKEDQQGQVAIITEPIGFRECYPTVLQQHQECKKINRENDKHADIKNWY